MKRGPNYVTDLCMWWGCCHWEVGLKMDIMAERRRAKDNLHRAFWAPVSSAVCASQLAWKLVIGRSGVFSCHPSRCRENEGGMHHTQLPTPTGHTPAYRQIPLRWKMHPGIFSKNILHKCLYSGFISIVGCAVSKWFSTQWLKSDMPHSEGRQLYMSWISLCLIVGNPPLWHIMSWSTVKDAPQMHDWDRLGCCHPYLKHRASLNAPLWWLKPWSVVGTTVSHKEAPFLVAQSMWISDGS